MLQRPVLVYRLRDVSSKSVIACRYEIQKSAITYLKTCVNVWRLSCYGILWK